MSLDESIVEDAALTWFGELGDAAGRLRESIRRLSPTIAEGVRAVVSILENTAAICERSTP